MAVIKTDAAVFLTQTVVPEGFPFSQLNFNNNVKTFKMYSTYKWWICVSDIFIRPPFYIITLCRVEKIPFTYKSPREHFAMKIALAMINIRSGLRVSITSARSFFVIFTLWKLCLCDFFYHNGIRIRKKYKITSWPLKYLFRAG